MRSKINYYILIPKTKVEMDIDRLVENMNIIIEKNKEFIEKLKNVKIACDNFKKAMVKYMSKNKYKILKELIEENNKRMGNYGG